MMSRVNARNMQRSLIHVLYVNKQEFSASSWRSTQGYTKMHGQPAIKIHIQLLICSSNSTFVVHSQYYESADKTVFYKNTFDVHESMNHDIIAKITNKMQLYRLIYYSKSALHVSGDVFAHHQEHLTIFTVSGSIHPSCCQLVSWMS